ncbi:hypothetical protein ACFROC_30750 [Nocardia tengchongensis]|uniref:hypothetical protein n=1 Tax=Nocardia tengchongensis TaxID=2055889 RepID=UPI0036BC2801
MLDWKAIAMSLKFLGKSTTGNQSPTLYLGDNSYIVQGWRVPDRPDLVEIPHALLAYLEAGTCLGVLLTDTGHGTFTLTGTPIADPAILAEMDIPDHEASVEVPVGQEIRPDVVASR